MARRLTLGTAFALGLAGLALLLGLLLVLVFEGARETTLRAADALRRRAAADVARRVTEWLGEAEHAVAEIEVEAQLGIIDPADERALHAALLRHPPLTEIGWTDPRGQVARTRDGVRRKLTGGSEDPTLHPTYTVPREHPGEALWSDLAFAERGDGLVLSVQKAVLGGVVRASLSSERLDAITDLEDAHRVLLMDRAGRLITRLGPRDRYATLDAEGRPHPDGDVRVVPAETPPEIAALRTDPRVSSVRYGSELAGRAAGHFSTVVAIPGTRGWLAAVVVPEELYLGALASARDRWLLAAAALIALILTGGSVALRTVRRALGAVVDETARMRNFDFHATVHPRPLYADVAEALASLEQAKTALRAMGKYVPVDLVRQLYEAGREPELGGEPTELTVMFTDIADFTTVAEALPPDTLAHALGRYLEVMAGVVAAHGGTVDKYIGDAVMALWNAPRRVADHAARGCRAALACVAALEELYASDEWRGLPRFTTRFGLHTDTVLVGHFGAPDRLSFTALGDGVNLASRLEGLNKSLGTTILVSEATARAAGEGLPFVRVARTAVKGRRQELDVYALAPG